jgi:hypothetical protein
LECFDRPPRNGEVRWDVNDGKRVLSVPLSLWSAIEAAAPPEGNSPATLMQVAREA